ncbi:M14 family zinc carboxypeptidase [Croceivirga thetidis]|uniref:Peptidase M14 n=1 Tax=Croceivirga thetidis TaxID=2721623 RepID=A0ABX1GTQ0_9FLAO|nr:M14 family zinc carboxypeptidase [Croceivirga thetidis]NKI32295.1 peptidase M14 [Croceivirga thetidis]
MRINLTLLTFLITGWILTAQDEFTSQLYQTFNDYKENSLQSRRIKYSQLQPLIERIKKNGLFKVTKVGESIEGRDLNLISLGTGSTDVFLWSQMHGDEPTATMAIFDIFNFIIADGFAKEKEEILSKLRLHFIPMLNPDGAEVFSRRNVLGIDINRDALRLQSPEGRTLKKVRDSLNPVFGFNLHDQSRYYNAEHTPKPATISYLAPAYNYEKEINEIRGNAMRVIAFMNNIIQKYAPGQVGRYNDTFEPRAFGDNLTKWGTGVILIESGGFAGDREKQEIRKLNYVSILSALYTIANESYREINLEEYEKIPRNDRKLFDLKIENVTYELLGKEYVLDLGINRNEIDLKGHTEFYYRSVLSDQGDLSTYYGYETFNAEGYKIIAPKKTSQAEFASNSNMATNLLKAGYGYLEMQRMPNSDMVNLPYHVVNQNYEVPEFKLQPGINPTFFLEKNGILTHAVINGFLLRLDKPLENQKFGNALIFK